MRVQVSVENAIANIIVLLIAIMCLVMLVGCSRHDSPINDINAGIQESVAQLEDYAINNMEMDSDKQLLLNGAKDCAARADALTKSCQATIKNCESEQTILRMERNGLALVLIILLLGGGYLFVRRKLCLVK